MKTNMKTLEIILILILVFMQLAKAEEEKEPWVRLPAKYASKLPECDRIEVFLLSGMQSKGGDGTFPIRPYERFSKIEKKTEIKGEQAKKLCASWRNATFDFWSQSWCHFPIYGLRFYEGDTLHLETSVCLGCSNFYFTDIDGKILWHGFRKKDNAGKALIANLSEIIPIPEKKNLEKLDAEPPASPTESEQKGRDEIQPDKK
jgi:hypothetical protein